MEKNKACRVSFDKCHNPLKREVRDRMWKHGRIGGPYRHAYAAGAEHEREKAKVLLHSMEKMANHVPSLGACVIEKAVVEAFKIEARAAIQKYREGK